MPDDPDSPQPPSGGSAPQASVNIGADAHVTVHGDLVGGDKTITIVKQDTISDWAIKNVTLWWP